MDLYDLLNKVKNPYRTNSSNIIFINWNYTTSYLTCIVTPFSISLYTS